jgi:hypothetical protein
MNAQYFYNELISGRHYSEGYDGWYANSATIHETGSGDSGSEITIFSDGSVIVENPDGSITRCGLSHLTGDYEHYSSVQLVKSGYVTFSKDICKSLRDVQVIMKDLHDMINAREDGHESDQFLCGSSSWVGGFTDEFTFGASTGIEVQLYDIPGIKEKNKWRMSGEKKCYPFKDSMPEESSIYVAMVTDIKETKNLILDPINTTKELISLIKEAAPLSNPEWKDCYIRKFVYC